VVWYGKPWVVPLAVVRTVSVVLLSIVFLFLEMFAGIALTVVSGLTVFLWTLFAFTLVWLFILLDLLLYWAARSYVLRQDGLEIKRGIIRLNSFVVTPSGFGDLSVYQSHGGRIFGYGELTVNSQGDRHSKLPLVRSPFTTADTIRDVMAKPIVRVEDHS
jgi:membrane protein YdbS with pleckstrin-like domain